MKLPAILTALLALSACNTPVHPNEPDDRKGYLAGCDTGYWRAGALLRRYNKDEALYDASQIYREAWDDGFSTCYERQTIVDQLGR